MRARQAKKIGRVLRIHRRATFLRALDKLWRLYPGVTGKLTPGHRWGRWDPKHPLPPGEPPF